MKRFLLLCLLFVFPSSILLAQTNYSQKGQIQIGTRTTTSLFGHDSYPGLGSGGQFRVQLTDYLNTEWFADWISIDLDGTGVRQNAHIGWSVLFYPKKMNRFVPYVIAGHCFDFAKVIPLSTEYYDRSSDIISRWSSAVQAGLGSHYYLSDRFNMTLSAQYMLHLGNHLEYEITNISAGNNYLVTHSDTHQDERFEGHLFLTLSLNYRIADLW